ncbi:unnamed protein product [Candida verbasci]|uniref:DNA replication complex GINS protein PSF2 n=1 Tax=Candida verbasci TaxID=1227364 RepID=A0A9W4TWK7_9ASCO|nr:unnamed protein product [Candida verbasci]
MVLPSNLIGNLTPNELSFLTENEMITILPRYSMNKIDLIGTSIPKLRAMRREKVPLWVALILKSQSKCNIVPPDWLNHQYLKDKYDEEIRKANQFSALPFNWLEITKIFLDNASDDLQDSTDEIRSIIQDLKEIRLVKSRRGLKELNESNIQLNGLGMMEINEIRTFVIPVMNKLRQLHDTTVKEEEAESDEDEMSE